MHLDDYCRFDAVGLAELVRRKEVTPEELLQATLAAIARVNPRINAVIDVREADARNTLKQGPPEGAFRGVPFLVKDLVLHTGGMPTDLGSRLGKGMVFPQDTALAARFKRAGLVTVGRTNTPEFGNNATTEPVLHGPTRNPWDLERSSGGSSGGSAAAVAAGIVPVAHGNDGGGSLRIPSALCGLFGMKPTRGRISLAPDMGEALNGMGIEHVISRTVRDSAAMMDATCGPEAGDPYYAPPPERPFLDELKHKPRKLRIALSRTAVSGVPVSADCIAAVEDAARLCTELGHEVVEAGFTYDDRMLNSAMTTVWAGALAGWAQALSAGLGRPMGPETLETTTLEVARYGAALKASDLQMAVMTFNQVSRTVGAFFQAYDMLLTPTVAVPPYKLGVLNTMEPRAPEDWYAHVFSLCPFTAVFNVTGQPAMSVPLHWNKDGLPIGVQFAGRYADEATLFRLAAQLEEARPWAGRRPPVHATAA
ncbi:amidase [Pyxidicoccus parkwayensis]|uniref:Amidase n=1 Tax=Pyxidicoccus parkwayensis TaxID=2813578 RepID=A0ABX7PAR6_9BACT|nr:amidase [Pyxidicoccus parkwaysis]QSQ27543.1 amidase [Pyxidicoccus parkwaysis]